MNTESTTKTEEPQEFSTSSDIILDLFGKPQIPRSVMEAAIIDSVVNPKETFNYKGLTREELEGELRLVRTALSLVADTVEKSRQYLDCIVECQGYIIKRKWELEKLLTPIKVITRERVMKPVFDPELQEAILLLSPEELKACIDEVQMKKSEREEEDEEVEDES